jgi:hypothetical protein
VNPLRIAFIASIRATATVAASAAVSGCGPTQIVSGSDWAPTSVAADSQNVYFTNNVVLLNMAGQPNVPASTLTEVPLDGGARVPLAWNAPPYHDFDSITAFGQTLYWQAINENEKGTVFSVSRAGGVPVQLLEPVTSAFKPPRGAGPRREQRRRVLGGYRGEPDPVHSGQSRTKRGRSPAVFDAAGDLLLPVVASPNSSGTGFTGGGATNGVYQTAK